MTADLDSIPLPRVLYVEADDKPGFIRVGVQCCLCHRVHIHDAHMSSRVFLRVPHCLVRLDVEQVPYVIDLTQDLDIEGVDDDATP